MNTSIDTSVDAGPARVDDDGLGHFPQERVQGGLESLGRAHAFRSGDGITRMQARFDNIAPAELANRAPELQRLAALGGFVQAAGDFEAIPAVINGCSDLMVEVFGDKGQHARSAFGVAQIPLGACVEIELVVEVD